VRQVCGLQAQLAGAAALGLRVRARGVRRQHLAQALVRERSVVRTWLMRGTLHLVAADDLGWMLALLGPIFAAGRNSRHTQLGLDRDLKERGVAAIRRVLAEAGPLSRQEIVQQLRNHGITLDSRSQAPIHLIQLAAFEGVLCLGPDRDNGEPTYVLIEDWLGRLDSIPTGAAPAQLARRYLAAFGPATAEDFATWSGLPIVQARSAMATAGRDLDEVMVEGRAAFLPKGRVRRWRPRGGDPAVRLLPAFDTYLLGYRSRTLVASPPLRQRLQRGGGWLHPAVVVNGRAVAAWSLDRAGRQARITIEPFERLTRAAQAGIETEGRDIGRFLDLPVALRIGKPAAGRLPDHPDASN
jgi:Winged helix DNA-binding domain